MPSRYFIRCLIISLPAIALVGAVILSLLGYGAAAAIESTFGISRELTYGSPLDLLHLSSHVIAGWVEALDSLWELLPFRRFALMMASIGFALTMLMLVSRISVTRKWFGWGCAVIASSLKKRPVCQKILSLGGWIRTEKLCFVPLILFSAAPWFLALLLATVVMLFAIVPSMGFKAAKAHLHNWIVTAEYCSPIGSRDARMKIESRNNQKSLKRSKITPCVALWKNGVLIAEGRHLASTDTHIILFEPSSGKVQREPTEGVSVHVSGMPVIALQELINSSNK